MQPLAVSAVVVNYSRAELLAACLGSARRALAALAEPAELIVVDNGSPDRSVERVRRDHPEAALVALGENRGFAGGANRGIQHARGEWILLLNNDVTLDPAAPGHLLAAGSSADVGSVACQLRFVGEPPVVNSAGIEVDRLGVAYDRLLGAPATGDASRPTEVFGASAGAALYRRAMLDDVGGFDESFFAYLEDADVAWRARMRGWRALYAPRAVAHHHHSATARHGSSFKHFHVGRNRVRLLAKNAHRSQLLRYGIAILAYDLAYVAFAAATDRTLAPLRGRARGLRDWRSYRRAAPARRPVELRPAAGLRAALRRRSVYSAGTSRA